MGDSGAADTISAPTIDARRPDNGIPGGAPANLKILPTAADFGSVEVNKGSVPLIFTVKNTGTGTAGTPQITIVGGDFVQTNTCNGAINGDATCTISVSFRPTTVGMKMGSLIVGSTPGGQVIASLSGVAGIAEPTLTPAAHDFGPVVVGTVSDVFTWTITNTGSAAIQGLAVNVNGADFAAPATGNKCNGVSLAPGASCTVDVQFKPASRGLKNGSLMVSANGQTVNAALTGVGAHGPEFAISPMAQAFVAVTGKEGSPVTFTVANFGDISTAALSVALGGADAGSFKVVSQGCFGPLPSMGICQIAVAVHAAAPGYKTATLTVSSPVGGWLSPVSSRRSSVVTDLRSRPTPRTTTA
jgi:hypothetical protein